MHLGLARQEHGLCARRFVRVAARVTVALSAASLLAGPVWAGGAAATLTRTSKAHHVAVAPEPQFSQQSARVKAKAAPSKTNGEKAGLKKSAPRVVNARQQRVKDVTPRRAVPQKAVSQKPGVRAHGRKAAVPKHDPVEMKQTSGRRPRGRAVPRQVAERSKPAAVPVVVAAQKHELTTDDFLRASGAAVPADDVETAAFSEDVVPDVPEAKLAVAHAAAKPLAVKRPAVVARVESNDPVTLPPERTVASDEPAVPTPTAAQIAALTHPTHEELADEAVQPVVLPGLYRNGRLIVPAPLKGTRDILVHQNLMADDEGLERIRDDDDLARLRASHQLVDFPETMSLHVNPELAWDRKCARPWTVHFASDIARQFYARFRQPLQVNSAARTVAYQLRLQRVNGNAAGVGGEVASPHLTGQAIDFGKSGMSIAEIAWMRAYLKPLMDAGKVDVEEEFQQACFHISVYRSYLPAVKRAPKTEVASLHVTKPVVHAVDRDE